MGALTPMMQQYLNIKDQYKDCILFFRLGDFYEMFFDDAETASRELEITLTGRDCGQQERAPMCGVPFHSADAYIAKLIGKGYKVAICEQIEDPSEAKGIVQRDVIRVVTPGTVTDAAMLDEKKNNFLACIYKDDEGIGLSVVDVTTGELYTSQFQNDEFKSKLINELARYSPSEAIANTEVIEDSAIRKLLKERFNCSAEYFYDWSFVQDKAEQKITGHFNIHNVDGLGLRDHPHSIKSVGALLEYLYQTQKISLSHINSINYYSSNEFLDIDLSTRRNLELTETMREKAKKGSLLWVLDKTQTAMGGRLLRKWIEQPLTNCAYISKRLQAVNELVQNTVLRLDLSDCLNNIYDIERLLSKIIYGSVNGRDLVALKKSIAHFPEIKAYLSGCNTGLLKEQYKQLDELRDINELIDVSIVDDPPFSVREGGMIKDGYDENVDHLRKAMVEGKQWIARLENEEKEKTGIKNLKVGFNKVFGYFIEVTKSHLSNVPDRYIRKQTLANCERYITPELKEIENSVLGAEEKIVQVEYHIFCDVREKIAARLDRIQKSAKVISIIDVLCSLGEVAQKNNYSMPDIELSDKIIIKDGRHPVVEKMLNDNMFVPNDTSLDNGENRLSIITGPNMAGKSTYMRQVALIVLMAQIGSFVPASSAQIGVVDKIFTRVGASDDLASGQSTFMVEMSEVANILNNATQKSLLILDEIGRGTSTYDGLSIAWAVIEYVSQSKKLGAKTLFATHYHELTELEDKLQGVKNYCIAVKKRGDDITFLRKIIRGGADDSYGIEVAKLAGVPDDVINRAKQILKTLEDADVNRGSLVQVKSKPQKKNNAVQEDQMGMFGLGNHEIIDALKKIEVTTMTPIEAMNLLYELQQKAKKF
ncbi:DNA mismatch repair protein MutS [Petroclostridium sp. X23]|uniref:DNA mismatch repair protein MutS n=1 Tax=Petroclostridium sp. X23 TaxID=3045146 RepID=UPI0024AD0DC9|nr:DNA mismatch repair protein MutS [Petroclostridium sp. X23]WHH59556.1 DNA mismatch repair protein MutS [Petroclostridium sp. X23]